MVPTNLSGAPVPSLYYGISGCCALSVLCPEGRPGTRWWRACGCRGSREIAGERQGDIQCGGRPRGPSGGGLSSVTPGLASVVESQVVSSMGLQVAVQVG